MSLCCQCMRLKDVDVVLGGSDEYDEFVRSIEKFLDRGAPRSWLSIGKCSECGQWWLVAEEFGQYDALCLRRLKPIEVQQIVDHNIWPEDFNKYETLLRLGHNTGRIVFRSPTRSHPTLPSMIRDLAKERPGITISEIAELFTLDISLTTEIAKEVVNEEAVEIDFELGQDRR